MKILIFGVTGMIGHAMFRVLGRDSAHETIGTIRSESDLAFFDAGAARKLLVGVDVENCDALMGSFVAIRPEIVINCVGATKHKASGNDALTAIPLNALLPHRLARLCAGFGSRLIHISTDCVYSGKQGNYTEDVPPDADDVYGRTKALGELEYPNTITLRTSTIGHELRSHLGLLEWFLAQQDRCRGFRCAVFSGLPSVTLAQIVRDLVIPNQKLSGLFHVAGPSISKYELLMNIAEIYKKSIEVVAEDAPVIDRSLNADRFFDATGYRPPDWRTLIGAMHRDRQ
ncbi:MAG: SDR family oxidoreductase [Gemmatimonadota bacterium]|nr:SDR family oxidoreductase [Gemmatimonadota bacterium]